MCIKNKPNPSIIAKSNPPKTALAVIAGIPLRAANIPPVKAPLAIEFQGSSFFLIATKEQSIVENKPPHTAKLPPILGALVAMEWKAPYKIQFKVI